LSIAYRKDIDGLRAIAVLAVLFFHIFPNSFSSGFIGVDIFFVISGFLITKAIINDLNHNRFSIKEFYVRRVKRIFPALCFVISCVILFGWFALLGNEFKQLGKHIAAGSAFLSNLFYWAEAGYFDHSAELKPLLHLWSLGIEEQFYIFYPLILALIFRKKINFIKSTGLIILVSLLLNLYLSYSDLTQAFYSPFSRFWELMLGGTLAWIEIYKHELVHKIKIKELFKIKGQNWASTLGILLLILAFMLIKKDSIFPGFWATLPILGTVLIIFAGPHSILNKVFLSNKLMIWTGLISYPLYLWHWPLISFANILENGKLTFNTQISIIFLSFVLAWLTQKFIEEPLRFGKKEKQNIKIKFLLGYSLFIFLTGVLIYQNNGFIKIRPWVMEQSKIAKRFEWPSHLIKDNSCGIDEFYYNKNIKFCLKSIPNKPATIAIIGDSHANHFYWGLENIYRSKNENLINIGLSACLPFYDAEIQNQNCKKDMNKILDYVLQEKNIHTILFSFFSGYLHADTKLKIMVDEYGDEEYFNEKAIMTFDKFIKSNKKIMLIEDNPRLTFQTINCFNLRPFNLTSQPYVRKNCFTNLNDIVQRENLYHKQIEKLKTKFTKIKFISANNFICDTEKCFGAKDNLIIFRDTNHITLEASIKIGRILENQLNDFEHHPEN
jgi:peptidoglycan/LPS O-acetylase OafA/YrhL